MAPQFVGGLPGLVAARGRRDRGELGQPVDVLPVDADGGGVVVDDQGADHGTGTSSTRARAGTGSLTVKTAPSAFSTAMLPRRRRTSWLTRARPRPRR